MNKFLAIIIALILSLMGCSEPPEPVIPVDNTPSISDPVSNDNKNDIKQPEETVQNTPESAFDENQENQDDVEQTEETAQAVPDLTSVSTQINTELFSILGMNKAEAIQRFGEIKETPWYNGPLFKYENCDYWFAYSDFAFYDDADGDVIYKPEEDAVITAVLGCTVADIFPDQDISESSFDETLKQYNEMDDEWFQYFKYEDIGIYIYYRNDNTINKISRVELRLK